MTHYYYFIAAGATWDGTTAIFKVAIGSTKQAQRDYLALTAHAVDNDYYLEIVSQESDIFIKKVLHSLAEYGTQIQHVKVRDLVRSIKSATALSLSPAALHNAHYQRMQLDTSYRIQSKLNSRRA